MGRVHGESEEGLRIVYSMKAILVFSLVTVAMSAPQYGGGSSQPVKAPVQSASVQCTTEYVEVWDTNYVETESQQCQTVYKSVCNTEYQEVCNQKYRDETEYYTETECNTDYKQDCEYQWEGTGNNKVWAPIQGTCKNNAYDKCEDVQKEKLKQVPYNDCNNV